ncbi:MAG: redoxin domain-containing protein, partial [Ferruginibacter sp.]
MARTLSTMKTLGTRAPGFTLPDTVSGKEISLEQIKGDVATVIMFICNHCPFVLHVNEGLVKLANDYSTQHINFVAISANDVITHPDDAP